MARILNASPVAIELARLAAQVREHAPYCGPERTYIVALRDLGRAITDEVDHAIGEGNYADWLRVATAALSDRMLLAVHAALAWEWCAQNGQEASFTASLEVDAMTHLSASTEWAAWIAERGPCADSDLTPEARAENEWKRNMTDARVRNVTSLT